MLKAPSKTKFSRAAGAAVAFALLSSGAMAQDAPQPQVQPRAPEITAPSAPALPTGEGSGAPAAESAPAAAPSPTGAAPEASAPATPADGASNAPSAAQPGGTTPETAATPSLTPSPTDGTATDAAADAGIPLGTGSAEALAPEALAIPADTLPHDLSPWGMFMAADMVVKGVMLGLALASLACWTILVVKAFEIAGAKRNANRALRAIHSAQTLEEARVSAGNRKDPAAFMLRAAEEEYQRSEAAIEDAGGEGVKERVSSLLGRIELQAGRRLSRGTGILATVGSIAPFVGLFGTVWGIMNSFIGISESQTTNLAVVAPGIAEALLATAIGLVAAIPAVVIYNMFARSITGYRALLGDAGAGIERLVSRDLDFRNLRRGGLRHRQAAE
ncbi:tonB-system energizer ExbB [Haematobacter missouriensis]|uniref:Biopolymer transport protein ExbB n=1 Tax=Haematobacter missouriensis TaxID=366616 RepID=A0A212AJZ7_9RHOB|nr:tonB-system energizer ExbB [Haematobacter missouriensis]OWJ76784.1 tonB-system energizer ExbB [Haematobacter missouriensis]OWJ81824.1 tonB-system energizer ExbB [Haematobacter missouriensis]